MLRPLGLAWVMMTSPPRVGEELRGDGGGGSVGAVDDDAAAVEGEVGDGGEEEADVVGAVGFVDLRGDGAGVRGCWLRTRKLAEDFVFDGEFGGVGELVAVGAEELDAVVLPGIVRGGDDDAGGEVVGVGEEGDGGSGDDAGALDGGAAGGEAGGEGGGDPVAGLAGVHAEEDSWGVLRRDDGRERGRWRGWWRHRAGTGRRRRECRRCRRASS